MLNHVWLFVTPWTVAHQAPLSMEFSRQEILEWVVISFSKGSSRPRDQVHISCVGKTDSLPLCHLGSLNLNITALFYFPLILSHMWFGYQNIQDFSKSWVPQTVSILYLFLNGPWGRKESDTAEQLNWTNEFDTMMLLLVIISRLHFLFPESPLPVSCSRCLSWEFTMLQELLAAFLYSVWIMRGYLANIPEMLLTSVEEFVKCVLTQQRGKNRQKLCWHSSIKSDSKLICSFLPGWYQLLLIKSIKTWKKKESLTRCTFLRKILFMYFWLCWAFIAARGLLSSCSVWASRCSGSGHRGAWALGHAGFSSCGSWAPEHGSVAWCTSLFAPCHVESSHDRDQTGVSGISRRILYHWATKEAQDVHF